IWTSQCRACSSRVGASYPVFVHRLALLLHASFRPRLATTPLRFANPSPPSGWVEDFHFQAAGHAQHTLPRRHSCRRLPSTLSDIRDTAGTSARATLVSDP